MSYLLLNGSTLARHASSSQAERLGRVIPENLGARLTGNLVVAADRADGLVRELIDGVAVRIVGGDHQIVVADVIDEDRRQLLAGLAADPAVALEVIARFFFRDFAEPWDSCSQCSSMRSSQNSAQPQPDSRWATFSLGNFSRTPSAQKLRQASICSSGWQATWRPNSL